MSGSCQDSAGRCQPTCHCLCSLPVGFGMTGHDPPSGRPGFASPHQPARSAVVSSWTAFAGVQEIDCSRTLRAVPWRHTSQITDCPGAAHARDDSSDRRPTRGRYGRTPGLPNRRRACAPRPAGLRAARRGRPRRHGRRLPRPRPGARPRGGRQGAARQFPADSATPAGSSTRPGSPASCSTPASRRSTRSARCPTAGRSWR